MLNNEYIFMWLHSYIGIDYFDYLELIKYFKDVEEIYNMSLYSFKFKNFINSNCIKISNSKIYKLCDFNLKKVSKKMFYHLKSNNIVILTIDSINFPINNFCIVVYAKGNLNNLNKCKVSVYYDNNFSKYGFKVYDDFTLYLKSNNISVVSDYLDENVSIYLINSILNYNEILRDDLLILSFNLFNYIFDYNILFSISNSLFIPESSYNYKCVLLVDFMLDCGLDIYVVPGNIYDFNSYFSNYLIYLGACTVTNKYSFLKLLKEK